MGRRFIFPIDPNTGEARMVEITRTPGANPVRHGQPPPSLAMGVMPDQAREANIELAKRGLEGHFDERTGDPTFPSRRAKLKCAKAMGYVDRDEVRG